MDRRIFLASALGLSASGCAVRRRPQTASSHRRILGANDRIRVGGIGLGAIGAWVLSDLSYPANTEVACACDLDERGIAQFFTHRQKRNLPTANIHTCWDFRRVLDDGSLDAVYIATPDHWHTLIALMAMERGLHVFLEKPIARYYREAMLLAKARAKFRSKSGGPIVLQVDQWQRSDGLFHGAIQAVRSGVIGRVKKVRGWIHGFSPDLSQFPESEPFPGDFWRGRERTPPDRRWDRWLGPAPVHVFSRQLHPFHWRWNDKYGEGNLPDWGVHLAQDIGLWAQEPQRPTRFIVTVRQADKACPAVNTVPDKWHIEYNFGIVEITFEHDGCPALPPGQKRDTGILFCGEGGSVTVADAFPQRPTPKTIFVNRAEAFLGDEDGALISKIDPIPFAEGHCDNFINAVRAGNPEMCRASLEKVLIPNLACIIGFADHLRRRSGEGSGSIYVNPGDLQVASRDIGPFLFREYRKPWDEEWVHFGRLLQ